MMNDDFKLDEEYWTQRAIWTHGGYEVDWKVIGGEGGYWIHSLAPDPVWIFMGWVGAWIKGEI